MTFKNRKIAQNSMHAKKALFNNNPINLSTSKTMTAWSRNKKETLLIYLKCQKFFFDIFIKYS